MKEEIRETRIEHGPTILTDKMPGVRSATLGFFFKHGSRHEPAHLNGISHFIEHAVFKGTTRRTALEIAMIQDRLGGNLDAFTTHEETGFAIKVIDDRLEAAFDLLSDMLTDPRFDAEDLKSEKKVILEELKMVEDSPEEFLGEIFSEAFFPGHPLGMNIAGTPATLNSFDHDITRSYFLNYYQGRDLVIAAAGNVSHDDIVDRVVRAFAGSSADRPHLNPSPAPVSAAPIVVKDVDHLEQAHLILAVPLPGASDERRYAADLLSSIVGGGTSSRLWQKVREERGLAYSVGASTILYQDTGLFSVFAAASPDDVGEVVDIAIAEMKKLVAENVDRDELELAKEQATASILMSLEDSALRAAALAQSEMIHGTSSVEETLERINSVTLDEIGELTTEHFRTESVAFAALGDLGTLEIDRDRLRISP